MLRARPILSKMLLTVLPPVSGSLFQGSTPPASLTVMMAITCCTLGLVVGVLVFGFVVSVLKKRDQTPAEDPPETRS